VRESDRDAALSLAERAAVLLLLATLALFPFGRSAELAIALGALAGLICALRGWLDWGSAAVRLSLLLFCTYWLPELVSAIDAVDPSRAWREVAADLRYLPFLLFACVALRSPKAQRLARIGCAWILAVWLLDALVQASTGWSLGGPASADRLSGLFGADDLKLGVSVAVLSPFLLLPARSRWPWLLGVALAVVIVVLLAGSRAGWVSLALVLAVLSWQTFGGGRRAALALLAALLVSSALATAAYQGSETFRARIERSAAALDGGDGIDHALSGRLPIWRTAIAMFRAEPINGVGVRGFRTAYAEFAEADDPWIGIDGDAGAFHAHQIVLEVASETGAFGLLCWIWAGLIGLRIWRDAAPQLRAATAPVSLALLVMLFPLNTHYAFYSSAWGGLLFFLLALWVPMITARPAASGKAQGASARTLQSA